MLDREFTFSDPQIIAELQKNFVPVAGNTHELQNGRNPVRDWFMEVAGRINPRVKSGTTAQGFYVVAADGKAYGFNNNRAPKTVLNFIRQGEAKFKQDPPAAVTVPEELLKAQFAHPPEPTTSVMRVFSRIRPLPLGCDVLNTGIGRDHFWIYPEEVKAILDSDKDGKSVDLPKSLSYRLARYHLVDNVRGEPDMWDPSQIKACTFTATKAPSVGGHPTYRFHGVYDMATADAGHGLKGTLDGQFTLDPATQKVMLFRAYGEADAWGRGNWTPSPPPGHFRIVFAVINVSDDVSKITPPQAAAYGDWDYRRPIK